MITRRCRVGTRLAGTESLGVGFLGSSRPVPTLAGRPEVPPVMEDALVPCLQRPSPNSRPLGAVRLGKNIPAPYSCPRPRTSRPPSSSAWTRPTRRAPHVIPSSPPVSALSSQDEGTRQRLLSYRSRFRRASFSRENVAARRDAIPAIMRAIQS